MAAMKARSTARFTPFLLLMVAACGSSDDGSGPTGTDAGADAAALDATSTDAEGADDAALDAGVDTTTDATPPADATGDGPAPDASLDAASLDAGADVASVDAGVDAASPDAADATSLVDAGDDAGAHDAGGADVVVPVLAASVHSIDTGTVPIGSEVNLDGVYVTAIDATQRQLWIADTSVAASNGGIYVFRGVGAPTLAAGVIVGAKIDLDLSLVTTENGLKAIGAIPGVSGTQAITVLAGSPQAITPSTVSIASLVDPTNGPPSFGSLVSIPSTHAKVTAIVGGIATLTDGTNVFEMGSQIYAMSAAVGTCYTAIRGIATLDTAPTTAVPMILPRSASDTTTGTGCP